MNASETVNRWCQKAENDLKNAYHEIEHEDPALDTVCFHAQQTAEKYLKAFLVFSQKEIPRTHILIRLLKECISVDPRFSELLDSDIDELTDTTSGDVLNCRVTDSIHLDYYGCKHTGYQISEECLD